MTINRTTFFAYVRKAPFGGRLTPQQVTGLTAILDYWDSKMVGKDLRWLGYALATAFHETDQTIGPIHEYGRGKGKKYGTTFYGRGLVQLTWDFNYKRMGERLGIPLLKNPNLALELKNAVPIMFIGMEEGIFTGKKFSNYFSPSVNDPKGARRIINGTDKAGLIADYHNSFMGAINAATQEEAPKDVEPEAAKSDATPFFKDPQALVTTGGSIVPSLLAAINSPAGVAALVVIVTAIGLGVYFYLRNKEKFEKGV